MLGFGWKRIMLRTLIAALLGLTAAAQTQIDLSTQAKRVDFTGASSTKPVKTGVALPTTCFTGELFFNTSAAAGSNLYSCTATNTWTQQGGISNQNYSNPSWITSLAWGKLAGVPATFNAGQLAGRTISANTPSDLQYLGWNNSAS